MGNGGISGGVRFVCHVPLFFLAFFGTTQYIYVKKYKGVLLAPPLPSQKIMAAEGFTGPGVIVVAILNFFLWIPTITAGNKTLLYLGIMDTAIVTCLCYSLYIESTFVAYTRPQCAQVHANATANPRFLIFDRAGSVNMTDAGLGEAICNHFLAKWYMALVIAVLYGFSAVANLIGGTLASESNSYGYNSYRSSPSMSKRILTWMGFPFVLVGGLLAVAFAPLFKRLPRNIQGSVRYFFRSTGRWTWYKSTSAASKLDPTTIHLPRHLRRVKGTDEKLAQILLVQNEDQSYDTLQIIASHLHYTELVNLGLASKRIRSIMFPSIEDDLENRQLRFYSCGDDEKSNCWTCGVQVCKDCLKTRLAKESTVSFHMRMCEARCSNCFHDILSQRRHARRPCKCYTERYGTYANRRFEKRIICQDCSKMKDKIWVALRERRDSSEYNRLMQQSLDCSNCKKVLPRTGLRWWVCTNCKHECRGKRHPGYVEDMDV